MVDISNENRPGAGLLLEMALQTKRLVSLVQHPLIDRAVGRVATHATVAHRFVFVNERASLRGMALEAGLVFAKECHATADQLLLPAGAASFDGSAHVRVVTIDAAHLAFQHRVMMR